MGLFQRKAEQLLKEQTSIAEALPPSPPQDNYLPPSGGYGGFSGITDQVPLGMGGIGGMEKDTSREVAEYLTSNQNQIELIEAKFRGEKITESYDATTGAIKRDSVKKGEPLMNELGIQRVVGYLENMISKNSIMSNITVTFLSGFMIEENEIITSHLLCNMEKYAIKDADIMNIISMCENFIYICLTRGVERGESILLLKGRKENINRYVDDAANRAIAQSRNSIWSSFSGNNNNHNR